MSVICHSIFAHVEPVQTQEFHAPRNEKQGTSWSLTRWGLIHRVCYPPVESPRHCSFKILRLRVRLWWFLPTQNISPCSCWLAFSHLVLILQQPVSLIFAISAVTVSRPYSVLIPSYPSNSRYFPRRLLYHLLDQPHLSVMELR